MLARGTQHRTTCKQNARVVTVYGVTTGIIVFLNISAKRSPWKTLVLMAEEKDMG